MKTEALRMFESTVKQDGDDIFIKPLCDFFGIDPENQQDRIKNDPILAKSSGKKPMKTMFGDNYPRTFLTKKGFIRWIQIINPNIIDESLRNQFMVYQELVFDYMYGASEEQMLIANLNTRLQIMKNEYSSLGNNIRTTQRDLFSALNKRYQYSLPFETQNGKIVL